MSWRIQGISNSFTKAAALTTGKRTIGQLVHINNAGNATLTTDDLYYPLLQDFDVTNGDIIAEAQIDGIAKVFVETAASIVAGSPVTVGATGLGVKLATGVEKAMGYALATPAGNNDFIPVVLVKGTVA